MPSAARERRPGPITLASGLLLLLAIAAWLVVTFDPSLAWGGDNAMYLIHARNLIEGMAYNASGYIQNPSSYLAPPAYPPGFPLALAPGYALFGLDIPAFKIYVIGIYVVALGLYAGYSYDGFRGTHYGGWYWLAAIALLGLNPRLNGWTTLILSEGLFLGTVIAGLWSLRVAYDRLDTDRAWLICSLVGGFLIACALSTRIFGLLLIPSVVIFELTRYRKITRVGAVAVVTALVLWLAATVWVHAISQPIRTGADNGYTYLLRSDLFAHPQHLPATIGENLLGYVHVMRQYWSMTKVLPDLFISIWVLVTLGFVAWGFGYRVVKRYTVLEVFFVVYMMGLVPWHSFGTRYLVPEIPFYFFYLLVGLEAAHNLLRVRFPVLLVACVFVAVLTYPAGNMTTANFSHTVNRFAPNGPAAMSVYRYIENHTAPSAVFMTRNPRSFALFTRRSASSYTDNSHEYPLPSDRQLLDYFHHVNARYVLSSPSDPHQALRRLAARHPDSFHRVFYNRYFSLYRLSDAPG